MCDFIENYYLTEQVEAINEIAGYIANLKRTGAGLGEFIFDKQLHGSCSQSQAQSQAQAPQDSANRL
jgi:ferritin heavy chain